MMKYFKDLLNHLLISKYSIVEHVSFEWTHPSIHVHINHIECLCARWSWLTFNVLCWWNIIIAECVNTEWKFGLNKKKPWVQYLQWMEYPSHMQFSFINTLSKVFLSAIAKSRVLMFKTEHHLYKCRSSKQICLNNDHVVKIGLTFSYLLFFSKWI